MARPSWWRRVKASVQSGRSIRLGVEQLEDRTLLAAAGDLDPTFGSGGKVMTSFPGATNAQAFAVVVQPDSKIVVAGTGSDSSLLARYTPGGSLDRTFGGTGYVIFAPGFDRGLAVQADGKIVVGGSRSVSPTETAFVLARFNSNGSPDLAYGDGGTVTTRFGPGTGTILKALALQADGKILATGESQGGAVLARYNPNGSLDATFDGDGKAAVPLARVSSVLLQSDGKIVVAGMTNIFQHFSFTVPFGEAALMRLLPNGSPDPTFTNSPQAIRPAVFYYERALGGFVVGAALQPDGRIVVAAMAGVQSFFNPMRPGIPTLEIMLFRFEADGRLDSTFAQIDRRSVFSVNTSSSTAAAVAVAADGRIVVAGTRSPNIIVDFQLTRYLAGGSPDPTFGNGDYGSGGWVRTDFLGLPDQARAVALQADGKIVVAGRHSPDSEGNWRGFALARYIAHSNEGFVTQLYLDLLGRSADRGGLAFWVGLLDGGVSRAQVAAGIQSSEEYRTFEVRRLYRQLLIRDPEPAGLAAWVGFLSRGGTKEQVQALVLGSDEYFRRAGGTAAGFLNALYRDVLGRAPEPAAAQGWLQVLTSGVPRTTVAAAVLGSLEFDRREVQHLYRLYLRRDADPAGHAALTALLQRGVATEAVLAAVVGSEEYFSNV